jgi:hypothetical protein
MKINPECPVFKILARAAGIRAAELVEEDDKDEETGPTKYQTIDASGVYSPPKESWAQIYIAQHLAEDND